MNTISKIEIKGAVREIEDSTARLVTDQLANANLNTLNKFSESADGKLLFDGEKIEGGSGSVTISQAEGNSLTEKEDGLYVSFYNVNKYVDDEIVIGVWVDGKPIYRNMSSNVEGIDLLLRKENLGNTVTFVVSANKPSNSTKNTITVKDDAGNTIAELSFTCDIYGVYSASTKTFSYMDKQYSIYSYGKNNTSQQAYIELRNSKGDVLDCFYSKVPNGSNGSYASSGSKTISKSDYIVYEYTKIADTPNSFRSNMLTSY